jgi:hypothetical protein
MGVALLEHKWGKSWVPLGAVVFWHKQDTVAKRFADRKAEAAQAKDPAALVRAAEWALEHGLLREFLATMQEAAALDAKLPAVVNFLKVRQQVSQAPTTLEAGAAGFVEDLKKEGYKDTASEQGHYVLLHKQPDGDAQVRRRLALLEDTYQTYLYWFALQGKALPVPGHRLVAVLTATQPDKTEEFHALHQSFDNVPLVADGFTARRLNVVVLSGARLDAAYKQLVRVNQNYRQNTKAKMEDLVSGAILKERLIPDQQIPVLQLLALVQKSMEDAAERASTTHEGVRQLLAATGLLPRTVATGEWVRFGIAGFFETPERAFYSEAGIPSSRYLVDFKFLQKNGKLPDAADTVRGVITDRYFRQAYAALSRKGGAASDPKDTHARDELDLARSTSWALTYYLMKNKLGNVLSYLNELGNLPRDADYNAQVLEGCFARAFDLGSNAPAGAGALDPAKLEQLATAWMSAMERALLEVEGAERFGLDERARPDYHPALEEGGQPKQ